MKEYRYEESFTIHESGNKQILLQQLLHWYLHILLAKVGYAEIWPLFGSANQLLSVLALVACAVFLKKDKTSGLRCLWVPMFFMMAVTFTALGMTIYKLSGAVCYNRISHLEIHYS